MSDELRELADAAIESPAGQRLVGYELQAVVLCESASSLEQATELGRAAAEAPDGGAAMTEALFGDLPAEVREQYVLAATGNAYNAIMVAIGCLRRAGELLRVAAELDPGSVALTAMAIQVARQPARSAEDEAGS